jgi:hypothetical protein
VFVLSARGRAHIAGFLSRTALDAAVDDRGLATTVRTTGYHRTEGEKKGSSVLDETLVAARVTVTGPGGAEFSASVLRAVFSPALTPRDSVRQRFAFSGEELSAGSVDVRLEAGAVRGACEIASTSADGLAALAALRMVAGSARLSAGCAYLSPQFWAPLGSGAPGVSSGSNGASGWVRADYRSGRAWRLWSSARVSHRPWRSYHSELPDGSASLEAGAELRTKRDWTITVRTRSRRRSYSAGEPAATIEEEQLRTSISMRTGGRTPLRLSASRSASRKNEEEIGSMLAFSMGLSEDMWTGASCSFGLTSAFSRGRAAPLISYEPGLPGEFSLTSLNGPGTRWYIRVQMGVRAGWGLSSRLSGGPERGDLEFGIGLDARG